MTLPPPVFSRASTASERQQTRLQRFRSEKPSRLVSDSTNLLELLSLPFHSSKLESRGRALPRRTLPPSPLELRKARDSTASGPPKPGSRSCGPADASNLAAGDNLRTRAVPATHQAQPLPPAIPKDHVLRGPNHGEHRSSGAPLPATAPAPKDRLSNLRRSALGPRQLRALR